jgi:Uma2 family endonuclease
MTKAARRLTFEEYLNLEDLEGLPEGRCEFFDGELIELPPESEANDFFAVWLQFELAKLVGLRLVRAHTCELEMPVLGLDDPKTRYPDLVVLREEHLNLTQRRFTIKLDMPAPRLVVEVVSPGTNNRDRDCKRKRNQYQKRGIPEFWLIDSEQQTVKVLELKAGKYVEVGSFRGNDRIESPMLKGLLELTAEQIFSAGR